MLDALHAWAVVPAAVGACCMAADRGRTRGPEIVSSVFMVLGMMDMLRAIPALVPVAWTAILVVVGICLAVLSRLRTPRTSMTMHAALGSIVMGALLLMARPEMALEGDAAHHDGGSASLAFAFHLGAAVFVVGSFVLSARRGERLFARIQYGTMGLATLAMVVPLFF
ncbi:MAG TPA: hypothetical protein VNT53_00200 [Pseudolysinimonas sp.]|nr:hypothetical protein [Pseudolysinimonas sp.]